MFALLIAAQIAATPAAAPAKPLTAQEAFNAASAARDAGHYADAVQRFEVIEAGLPPKKSNAAVLGIIRIRKGLSLLQLERPAEAEAALQEGLKTVPLGIDSYKGDIGQARLALGQLKMGRFDYTAAKAQFEMVRTLAGTPDEKVAALVMLAYATMFDPDDSAIRYADEALALTLSSTGIDKKTRATVRTVRARALLNHDRKPEAYAELKKALAEQGGLDFRVSRSEIITRSDLAIAALLNNDVDNARKYMAYTGAGRFDKAPFATAAYMDLPACGGVEDLRPDDVGVVEFNVQADGRVGYATPIYASRPGPVAAEFARSVVNWSWKPEDAKLIPDFFRTVTRVELRCSANVARPSTVRTLAADLSGWLRKTGSRKDVEIEDDATATPVDQLLHALTEAEATGKQIDSVPILLLLAASRRRLRMNEGFGWRRRSISQRKAARRLVPVPISRYKPPSWTGSHSSSEGRFVRCCFGRILPQMRRRRQHFGCSSQSPAIVAVRLRMPSLS